MIIIDNNDDRFDYDPATQACLTTTTILTILTIDNKNKNNNNNR